MPMPTEENPMKLVPKLRRLLRLYRARRAAPRATRRTLPFWMFDAAAVPRAEDAVPAAAGWHDSSWALRVGVQVTEHDSVVAVANDLPLGWWLSGPGAALPRH
jgi:hypothetical protein